MNLRSDLEFTLDYAIADLVKIYEDKQNLISLNERIKTTQNVINNLHVILGYGTASEPMSSGELGALQTAMQDTKNAVVIDIGAHEGEYVGLMRGHFPSFQFHSFEPDPQSFAKMNDNLVKRFGEGHGVTTVNQAVAKHNGVATLYTHQIGAANSSLAHRELSHLGAKFDLKQTVQTKTLRSYCDQNNIEIIDYLKIDTEGTEFDIIESAMPMIEQNRIRFIQFEYGSCNVDTRTYLKDFYLLLRHKYNFYRIHPEGLYPCNEYQEAYECFNLCNYVLERYV